MGDEVEIDWMKIIHAILLPIAFLAKRYNLSDSSTMSRAVGTTVSKVHLSLDYLSDAWSLCDLLCSPRGCPDQNETVSTNKRLCLRRANIKGTKTSDRERGSSSLRCLLTQLRVVCGVSLHNGNKIDGSQIRLFGKSHEHYPCIIETYLIFLKSLRINEQQGKVIKGYHGLCLCLN